MGGNKRQDKKESRRRSGVGSSDSTDPLDPSSGPGVPPTGVPPPGVELPPKGVEAPPGASSRSKDLSEDGANPSQKASGSLCTGDGQGLIPPSGPSGPPPGVSSPPSGGVETSGPSQVDQTVSPTGVDRQSGVGPSSSGDVFRPPPPPPSGDWSPSEEDLRTLAQLPALQSLLLAARGGRSGVITSPSGTVTPVGDAGPAVEPLAPPLHAPRTSSGGPPRLPPPPGFGSLPMGRGRASIGGLSLSPSRGAGRGLVPTGQPYFGRGRPLRPTCSPPRDPRLATRAPELRGHAAPGFRAQLSLPPDTFSPHYGFSPSRTGSSIPPPGVEDPPTPPGDGVVSQGASSAPPSMADMFARMEEQHSLMEEMRARLSSLEHCRPPPGAEGSQYSSTEAPMEVEVEDSQAESLPSPGLASPQAGDSVEVSEMRWLRFLIRKHAPDFCPDPPEDPSSDSVPVVVSHFSQPQPEGMKKVMRRLDDLPPSPSLYQFARDNDLIIQGRRGRGGQPVQRAPHAGLTAVGSEAWTTPAKRFNAMVPQLPRYRTDYYRVGTYPGSPPCSTQQLRDDLQLPPGCQSATRFRALAAEEGLAKEALRALSYSELSLLAVREAAQCSDDEGRADAAVLWQSLAQSLNHSIGLVSRIAANTVLNRRDEALARSPFRSEQLRGSLRAESLNSHFLFGDHLPEAIEAQRLEDERLGRFPAPRRDRAARVAASMRSPVVPPRSSSAPRRPVQPDRPTPAAQGATSLVPPPSGPQSGSRKRRRPRRSRGDQKTASRPSGQPFRGQGRGGRRQ